MRNPLTTNVESQLGAMFIALFTLFMVGILFIAIKNFNSDTIVLNAGQSEAKSLSSTERQLISRWLGENNIEVPDGEGFRYVVRQYPSRPWLNY